MEDAKKTLIKSDLSQEVKQKIDEFVTEMKIQGMKDLRRRDYYYRLKKIESMKKRTEKLRDIKKTIDSEKKDEISLTDPEARQMKTRHGIEVCYNAQISVDDKNHLIADYDLIDNPNDSASLVPTSVNSKEFLQSTNLESLADSGYFSMENVRSLHGSGIDAYIPEQKFGMPKKESGIPAPRFHESRFVYDRETDVYKCPSGNTLKKSPGLINKI